MNDSTSSASADYQRIEVLRLHSGDACSDERAYAVRSRPARRHLVLVDRDLADEVTDLTFWAAAAEVFERLAVGPPLADVDAIRFD